MKPTFALNLSNERVGLLHRTGRGWLQVGDVAFDTPDLSEALAYLRRTALGLAPRGVSTKLVIPNSQILYIDVEAPGPDDETRRKQIAAGLVGRTPYAPDDLVFDWRGKGTMVKVAVVARETLAEAEAFAVEHRFNPVSFAALPDAAQFKGEPFFGMTDAARSSFAKGETVDADRDAMTIVTRDLPLADMPAPTDTGPSRRTTERHKAADVPDAGSADADAAIPDPQSEPAKDAEPDASPQDNAAAVQTPPEAEPPTVELEPEPVAAVFSSDAQAVAAALDEAPFTHIPDLGSVTGDTLVMAEDDVPPAPSKAAQLAFASRRTGDDARKDDMQASRPMGTVEPAKAGTSDPSGTGRGDFRSDFVAKRPIASLRSDGLVTAPSIPGSKKRKGVPTAPPPAVVAAAAALASSGAAAGGAIKPLTRPGGTFGAKPLPQRGKPRYLGWVLTGLLLVLLAIVAAWSTYYLAPGDAETGALDTAAGSTVAPEVTPAIEDEIAADQQDAVPGSEITLTEDPAAVEAPAAISDGAGLATDEGDVVDATVADPPAADPPVAEPSPDAASGPTVAAASTDATTPATDVPEATPPADATVAAEQTEVVTPEPQAEVAAAEAPAPEIPAVAPDLGTTAVTAAPQSRDTDLPPDEIFLATSDTPPAFQDALVLPSPVLSVDATPVASPPPPPFGTVYRFGDNGLIIPPAEGILSPDGIMLFAGAPPVTPPGRSAAVIAAAAAAVSSVPVAAPGVVATDALEPTAPETAPVIPADPAMAGFRPRPRPPALSTPAVENADDANLRIGETDRQATLRPRVRPDTIVSTGSAARSETANASLTAQSNAAVEAGLASAAATGNVMTLAVSRRPASRPKDMTRAVEAALAAAVRAPEPQVELASGNAGGNSGGNAEPEADEEPELASAAPRIPTKTNVAKQATFANAINLSKINLIGVYGTPSKRYALIRLASGRYKKVSVGDSVDGGQVAAITATEVRYQKGGRLVSLKMPKT